MPLSHVDGGFRLTLKPAWRPDFGPRDVVRCVNAAGIKPDCPLRQGRIYTVLGIEEGTRSCPEMAQIEPIVRLCGVNGAYGAFRFALVAPASPRPESNPTAARMAQVLRLRVRENDACTLDDLTRAGFTAAQIIEHIDEARGIAGAPEMVAA